ncbi:MAG: hypothetical protein ACXWQ5_05925 [Ktedonobacterales bacterium]
MDAHDVEQMTQLFSRIAESARTDVTVANQVREALVQSGLLDVFGNGPAFDVVELLDLGGENILRMRLRQMTLAELKQLVSTNGYDPEKEAARWRSQNKFIELIVSKAQQQLEAELAKETASPASWML